MRCEWCVKAREAAWWGKPVVGPESAMCDVCRDRICSKDEKGFIAIPIAEHEAQKQKKD